MTFNPFKINHLNIYHGTQLLPKLQHILSGVYITYLYIIEINKTIYVQTSNSAVLFNITQLSKLLFNSHLKYLGVEALLTKLNVS